MVYAIQITAHLRDVRDEEIPGYPQQSKCFVVGA